MDSKWDNGNPLTSKDDINVYTIMSSDRYMMDKKSLQCGPVKQERAVLSIFILNCNQIRYGIVWWQLVADTCCPE